MKKSEVTDFRLLKGLSLKLKPEGVIFCARDTSLNAPILNSRRHIAPELRPAGAGQGQISLTLLFIIELLFYI
jgi:hypothetical protein